MFKRIIILFLLITVYSVKCIGQKQSAIDSLLGKLSDEKIDTIKVNILANLAYEYLTNDVNKAMDYGNKSLDLAKQTNYSYGIALSLQNISYAYYMKSNYVDALNYAFQSIKEAQKINNNILIATNFGIIGNVYFAQKEYQKSKNYYQKLLDAANLANNNDAISNALNRMGKIYIEEKNYVQAIKVLDKALRIAIQIKNKIKEADCLFYLGKAYLMQKEYQKALQFFHECLQIDIQTEDRMSVAMSYKEIANAHYINKQLDSAITYSDKALDAVFIINSKKEILEIYNIMYLAYKEKKNLSKALYYHEQMMILEDSIYSKDKINAITALQTNYEVQQKELQIEKQNIEIQLNQKTIEEQNLIKNIFIVAFIIVSFLGYLFYKNYQKIQKTKLLVMSRNQLIKIQKEDLLSINEELNQQNEEIHVLNNNLEKIVDTRTDELKLVIENLSKQNQDLEQFSYIISHNLRAPVARILGLVSIFDRSEIHIPLNQEIFNYLEKATFSLDEVIKDLTQIISIRKNLTSIKEKVNIKNELDIVLSYFTEQIEEHDIEIIYHFQIESINSIKSYLQSILFNFVSNAIKYKSNKRPLVIKISSQTVDNFVCLSIKDNGIGMNLTNVDSYKIFGLYQRMHDHVEGKGLGLYLVKTQVEFLNGEIEVESKLDVGTTFKVYFPI